MPLKDEQKSVVRMASEQVKAYGDSQSGGFGILPDFFIGRVYGFRGSWTDVEIVGSFNMDGGCTISEGQQFKRNLEVATHSLVNKGIRYAGQYVLVVSSLNSGINSHDRSAVIPFKRGDEEADAEVFRSAVNSLFDL